MTRINFSIMAHPARTDMAMALADELVTQGAVPPVICLDRMEYGEVINGDHAWLCADPSFDWHVVLQDDAVLQPYSVEQMHKALEAIDAGVVAPTPCPLVSFYVGTGRPRMRYVQRAFQRADRQGAAWLSSSTLLWGVAVAMPTLAVIESYLPWSRHAGKQGGYDERLGRWARSLKMHQQSVLYTWPSLVDHADGPTLLQHPWGAPKGERIAFRLGQRDDWASVPAIPIDDWDEDD